MAYNKENYYKKIIEIQKLFLENYQIKYYTMKEVYYNVIAPKYYISYRTFNNYMGINAKAKLKELKQK